jgi:glutamine synthetase
VTVEGEPWPFCPRTILRNQLARAAELGYAFKMGCELEYFLVRKREDGGIELADPLDNLEQPCYDMRALTRSLGFVTDVARHVNALGWNIYATDHEDANGQFEQNFTFDDALVTCDRAVFFRYMVESLAHERGLLATFMPKPFAHLTGNGCHMHMSLWDEGRNIFETEDDPRGLGLSKEAYHFIGGLMAHAKAYIAVTAPTVNSYKRLKVGDPRSGATWAPVYVSYGYNNRTQMLRVPAAGRVEDRTVDGSCNPYLAATVLLAAGLDGIERELDPGDPQTLNLYETTVAQRAELGIDTLPENLLDATRELERDDVMRKALGSGSRGDYLDYFVACKRREVQAAHEQITQYELDRYLQLF